MGIGQKKRARVKPPGTGELADASALLGSNARISASTFATTWSRAEPGLGVDPMATVGELLSGTKPP
jgi:hypothetical protein